MELIFGESLCTQLWNELILVSDNPDSCVFFATLYKGFDLYRQIVDGTALELVRIMMRDGMFLSVRTPSRSQAKPIDEFTRMQECSTSSLYLPPTSCQLYFSW